MLSVVRLNEVMQIVIMLSTIMLSFDMLIALMLGLILASAVMLSVLALIGFRQADRKKEKKERHGRRKGKR